MPFTYSTGPLPSFLFLLHPNAVPTSSKSYSSYQKHLYNLLFLVLQYLIMHLIDIIMVATLMAIHLYDL